MENYTRLPDSIRKNKSLTSTEKIILGYLYTYQYKLVGKKLISTGSYCLETQDNLADEIGLLVLTLKRTLITLKEKGLIFNQKKGSIDGKSQYKNRLATIMVDEFNPLPTEIEIKIPKNVSKKISTPTEVLSPVTIKTKSIASKVLLKEILTNSYDSGDINRSQEVDLITMIDNDKFLYVCDLMLIINENKTYNEIARSISF